MKKFKNLDDFFKSLKKGDMLIYRCESYSSRVLVLSKLKYTRDYININFDVWEILSQSFIKWRVGSSVKSITKIN